jgi:hypothetical protein
MTTDQNATPTISRVLEDRTLVELAYDPETRETALAICERSGDARRADSLELPSGERLVPYSASNNLITNECVLLPSDIGDFRDKRDALDQVRSFIQRLECQGHSSPQTRRTQTSQGSSIIVLSRTAI